MSWAGRTSAIERPPIAEINQLAEALLASGRDLINLGQAVLGLPPPASAIAAVRAFLDQDGPHIYSPDPGLPRVRERVARFLREEKHIEAATADKVVLTCGANQAFINTLFALTRPGDEVVFFGPNYFDHDFAIKLGTCRGIEVPLLRHELSFGIDHAALERAISPNTRCMVLVSPANPAGMLPTKSDIERLCRLCARNDIWLISDETYDLLCFDGREHVAPASLGIHDKVVTIGSFSKTFGLAGWRIGYLHGPAPFVEESIKVQDAVVVCAPVPAQLAIAAALDETGSFCVEARRELQARRDAMLAALDPCPLLCSTTPAGGTFVFARISGGGSSLDFASRILRETGVISVPGAAFGVHGEGHLRLSFGNQSVERIQVAGDRLAVLG